MSSARKRAAIHKAEARADQLQQKLTLVEHQYAQLKRFAECAAARCDSQHRALTAVRQYPGVEEYLGTIITGLIDDALGT